MNAPYVKAADYLLKMTVTLTVMLTITLNAIHAKDKFCVGFISLVKTDVRKK
jgi:hypothetical protein